MSAENPSNLNPDATAQPYQNEQNSTYAGYLGLVDGQFAVERSSGELETGWQIVGQAITRNQEGVASEAAMIAKEMEDGTVLEKTVPLTDLYNWQRQEASSVTEHESAWQKHYEHVFSPILRPEADVEHPGFDHLLTDDPSVQEKAETYYGLQKDVAQAQQEHDKFVTPEARNNAVNTLIQVASKDKELANIISSFEGKVDIHDALNVVDAIRTNPDLRVAVGKHFVRKVNALVKERWSEMPDRIRDNTEKSISGPAKHVSKLSSREYVALLCLAHIDGTFNPMREDTGTEFDAQGRAIVGQHRAVAEIVLSEAA